MPLDGGGILDALDATGGEAKFDSTGMFHWCNDQLMEDCIVVGIELNKCNLVCIITHLHLCDTFTLLFGICNYEDCS